MPQYNLILVHYAQCVSDFVTIKNMMAGLAPDINVHVIAAGQPIDPVFWSKTADLPTLIFLVHDLPIDPSVRGTRLRNLHLGKMGEMEMLDRAGISIPRTVKIVPGTKLDEAEWGPLVVMKPDNAANGRGVYLQETNKVRWFDPRIYPRNDPRRGADQLAQQYVFTGPFTNSYRVFTVLGQIIYAIISISTEERPRPDMANKDAAETRIASNGNERIIKLAYDEDVLALAEDIGRKFPDIPNLGVDIIREHETGRLFVLEINSKGETWHLSTHHGIKHQRTYGLDLYGQFDGLRRIANSLIDRTRRLAT
jgi:hypothetical protein